MFAIHTTCLVQVADAVLLVSAARTSSHNSSGAEGRERQANKGFCSRVRCSSLRQLRRVAATGVAITAVAAICACTTVSAARVSALRGILRRRIGG